MPGQNIRVVFDCSLFVQAFLNPDGGAGRCFDLVRSGQVQLFVSRETLAEVKEVLSRPRILSLLPHATTEQTENFLEEIVIHAASLRVVTEKFRFERDPKDAPYLNLAIALGADYLVSRDKDLLDLMSGHTDDCKDFRQRFRNVKVVGPSEFLQAIRTKAEGGNRTDQRG